MFKNKTLLITGGTGSFGNAVLDKFLASDIAEIRIFSRDEKKQHDMRVAYDNPKLKFFIGDVRDYQSILEASRDVDYIFHSAALKQVPSCEFYPINAMGVSKAMMEKVFVAKSRTTNSTVICGTRYGNVMASRGSVIPHFHQQINEGKAITVTDPNMTRFMMTLKDAVDLVLFAFNNGQSGDIFVQKSPASTIGDLAIAMKEIYNSDVIIENIGIRHAEKMHETLLSVEERMVSEDLGDYYKVSADNRDLNYNKYFSEGIDSKAVLEEYNSFNTNRLSIQELKDLLGTVGYK